MAKHTPGPWTVDENEMLGRDIVSAGSMALVCTQVYNPDDARLIAAAPEMLELLAEYLAFNGDWAASMPEDAWVEKVRAVVAKAT